MSEVVQKFTWNVQESELVQDSIYYSPSQIGRGKRWRLKLQKVTESVWCLELQYLREESFEHLLQKILKENCFSSVSYSNMNDKDISVKLVFRMKKEMNSPAVFLLVPTLSMTRNVKQIKLKFSVEQFKCSAIAMENMIEYFNNLTVNDEFSDIEIKVENKIYPAHKIILAAHSRVFERMFKANMVETETGIVEIKDLMSNTIKILLQFMYTTEKPDFDTFCHAVDVYRAAHKYEVEDLLNFTRLELCSLVDKTNVLELLVLSQRYSDTVLEHAGISYISNWEFELDSEKCKSIAMEYPELLELLLQSLRKSV